MEVNNSSTYPKYGIISSELLGMWILLLFSRNHSIKRSTTQVTGSFKERKPVSYQRLRLMECLNFFDLIVAAHEDTRPVVDVYGDDV